MPHNIFLGSSIIQVGRTLAADPASALVPGRMRVAAAALLPLPNFM